MKKAGAWKYAQDFTTFILTLQLKVVIDERPQPTRVLYEKEINGLDPELMDLANDPTVIFLCHNAGFEQAMWKHHMVPLGYPELPPERWHDTMAVCAMKALPLGLDAAITALELPVQKDMDGHRLMLIMCKPDRIGGWSHHNEYNLKRLGEYGARDVEAQLGVYQVTRGLGPSERETWVLDQRINQRGIKIDKNFVHACMDVLDQVRIPMTEQFRELTGGVRDEKGKVVGGLRPTQREKVLNWVNDQGFALGDMKKATLDAILDPDDEFGIEALDEPLPYHIHQVLTLRRSLAASSVSKLQRMLDCASDYDGRVRYATQYHGARTGRDAGRLIQIQNYPRGEIGTRQGLTADALADAILTRNLDTIRDLWGPDIFSAVISSLRSCIVPEKGKVLIAGDLAQVEAKNLLSMAGQHDKADMLHSGQDAYAEMAALIYRKPINKFDNPLERQVGKNCLAADTMVLTRNGWKPIVMVQDTDLLWDGENWVTHKGLLFKGSKETLNLSGLRLTPDHLVFIGEQWLQAAALTPKQIIQALDFAKANGPCSATVTPHPARHADLCVNVAAAMDRDLWNYTTFSLDDLRDAINAQNAKPFERNKNDIGVMKTYARINRIAPEIYKIDWTQRLKKSGCCEPVYDLADAGPNHRFTVMTADGPLIVHNCVMGNGYGLGPVGFRARFCPKDSIELAKLAVTTYRKEFAPAVPKFWYGLWEASVAAVWCEHSKTYSYEGIEFRKEEGDFLTMRLPSGRKIWYHRPRKGKTYDFDGNERPSWTFMSYQGKKFRRHLAWHGMITADCIQGLSRDLIMGGMKRAEKVGLFTIFKVHDELVFEEDDRPDLEIVVKQIMEDIEPWAIERKLRIKAEVGKMLRYTK